MILWRRFWGEVWFWSEYLRIPLGRFAPWVFGQMIGAKGERVDKNSRQYRI